jgi:BASS family bile acid:Na+ symporter
MDKVSTLILMVSLIKYLANGDTVLSVTLTAMSSFVTIHTIPFIVNFALVLNVATIVVGYYSARPCGIRDKQALSISIESGIQNGTLAISISVILPHSTALSIAPAIYSLSMFFTGGIIVYIGLRRDKNKA